jgi:hypothetical protein
MRGIGFAGFDYIRVGDRRKWHIAGIFDRRRRWIGNRNFGWRKRRHVARRNARLGRGRLGNLLRMAGMKLFQHESPFLTRSRQCRRFEDDESCKRIIARFRKRPAARNRESQLIGMAWWP